MEHFIRSKDLRTPWYFVHHAMSPSIWFSRLLFALSEIHERKEVNTINKLPDALSQGKMDCVTSS